MNNMNSMNTMNNMNRNAMINMIQELQFMAVELNLYLNTHPCDQKAIMDYNSYVMKIRVAINQYQQMYGPLVGFGHGENTDPNRWKWIDGPWPWENEDSMGGMQ